MKLCKNAIKPSTEEREFEPKDLPAADSAMTTNGKPYLGCDFSVVVKGTTPED